jgi:hypothetical protein
VGNVLCADASDGCREPAELRRNSHWFILALASGAGYATHRWCARNVEEERQLDLLNVFKSQVEEFHSIGM